MIILAKTVAVAIVAVVVLLTILAVGLIIYYATRHSKERVQGSQRLLSDRNLLLLIIQEPDGMINAERLASKTELTKKEATSRLNHFYFNSILKHHYTSWGKAFYSLKEIPEDRELIDMSGKPYITVEDLLLLFKHHDYRLTPQQIIMSTGLPLSVIKEELKYFKKENIIEQVYTTDPTGMSVSSQFYLLKEPYRSNPDQFLEKGETLNLELERIYAKQYREDELL